MTPSDCQTAELLEELPIDELEELLISNYFDFEAVAAVLKPRFNCSAEDLTERWSKIEEQLQGGINLEELD